MKFEIKPAHPLYDELMYITRVLDEYPLQADKKYLDELMERANYQLPPMGPPESILPDVPDRSIAKEVENPVNRKHEKAHAVYLAAMMWIENLQPDERQQLKTFAQSGDHWPTDEEADRYAANINEMLPKAI